VRTIEEGIELLTGVPAGKPGPDSIYPEKSVFGAVQKKLAGYHKLSVKLMG